MWIPANDLHWQEDGTCALPVNSDKADLFFSKRYTEKNQAKSMCYKCPVRAECLQWALEHKQIVGVWGGRDEAEIKRTLSVSILGDEAKRRRPPLCPYCSASPANLVISVEQLPNGGRWKTAKVVTCSICGFAWRSRTSANAVEAYNMDKADAAKSKSPKRSKSKTS